MRDRTAGVKKGRIAFFCIMTQKSVVFSLDAEDELGFDTEPISPATRNLTRWPTMIAFQGPSSTCRVVQPNAKWPHYLL